jgi:hypothetical protein
MRADDAGAAVVGHGGGAAGGLDETEAGAHAKRGACDGGEG